LFISLDGRPLDSVSNEKTRKRQVAMQGLASPRHLKAGPLPCDLWPRRLCVWCSRNPAPLTDGPHMASAQAHLRRRSHKELEHQSLYSGVRATFEKGAYFLCGSYKKPIPMTSWWMGGGITELWHWFLMYSGWLQGWSCHAWF
jgi:hypothetical protein